MIEDHPAGDRAGEYEHRNVSYVLIDEEGPDHNKIFEVEASNGKA